MSRVLYFNITYACNNLCVFCAANFYGNKYNKRPELTVGQFSEILHRMNMQSGESVIINGGEPTVHRDFFAFLRVIKERGGWPILFTNGVKLAEMDFVECLAEYGSMNIRVPFFAASAEHHDFLTGRVGNFAKVLQGFKNIVELKGQGVEFDIEAKLLLSKATFKENRSIVQLLSDHLPGGSFYFSLNPLLIFEKVQENADLLIEKFSNMRPDIEATIDCVEEQGYRVSLDLVPLCVLGEAYADSFPSIRDKPRSEYYFDPNFTKTSLEHPVATRLCSKKCNACVYKHTCHGFYNEYLRIYGTGEITPYTKKPGGSSPERCFVLNLPESTRIHTSAQRVPSKEQNIIINADTASWAVVSDSKLSLYESLNAGATLRQFKDRFADHQVLADDLDELFYGGLLSLNGKEVISKDLFTRQCIGPDCAPKYLVLKYTRRCNLNCAYCYAHTDDVNIQDMPKETLMRILHRVSESFGEDNITVLFHGGEPLLRFQDMREAIQSARKKYPCIRFHVQSNGTCVNQEMAEFFRNENVSIGLSIDGFDFETNSLRCYHNGDNSLIDTLKGLEVLYNAGVQTGVISVITRKNYRKQAEMAEFFVRHGLMNLVFNDFFPGGLGSSKSRDLAVPVSEILCPKKELMDMINNYNNHRNDWEHMHERNITNLVKKLTSYENKYMCSQSPCGAGRRTLGFDCDGTMYPCDEFISVKDFAIGNIHEVSNLREHIEVHPTVCRLLDHNVMQINRCRSCPWRWVCPSHCASNSVFYTGHLNSPDSNCEFYQQIIPYTMEALCTGELDYTNFI